MKEQLLNLVLPEKYEEGLFEYKQTLDGIPEWPEMCKRGYTLEKYRKFTTLVTIEIMKYHLTEAINENLFTDDEVIEARKLLDEQIEKYNQL
ncbi:hypothetical protein M670_00447 [Schinkia azotoformans MEV2011]|uniref:Uncharacterized protein n=1 Tax=Schinkia azotoformans MEV2011 TaxID=1348973 RepID=A0A072NSF7_SCHAZ|nr:aspartyl-phosphate phosphatase Spo0E family protein [Schinkia azotoformans]KEF40421.1 hypothetical protein M670_00447 [Schinkia azotoformans MEV2011]MEC1696169.1 aspartyl-phosphate phosphatase Spo0E family protein [Schinkia azotoformans]MEC1725328.1 aspartyl-phosphate phosphatase Spo0E family protein [Schinkia azotoformans]MEC1779439.1 aspartyl-phosphate phosphatase Spo0E family protein [Schinkia azotoformans]MED4330076.1 aspartyl-phosphate phosphatase Spo0E family protein [Schinkia azotofo